jgi:hypothetical protein
LKTKGFKTANPIRGPVSIKPVLCFQSHCHLSSCTAFLFFQSDSTKYKATPTKFVVEHTSSNLGELTKKCSKIEDNQGFGVNYYDYF